MSPPKQVQSKIGMRVRRTYESERQYILSDHNATQSGYGFGFRGSFDAKSNQPVLEITRGFDADYLSSTTFAKFPGAAIQMDFINLTRVYRYVKIRKICIHVTKVPQMISQTISAVGGTAFQTEYSDPGQDIMIPWAANPDLVNYNNGEFTNLIQTPDIYKRYKYKKTRNVGAKTGQVGENNYTCIPRQFQMIPSVILMGGVSGSNPQVRPVRTPPIDIFRFRSSLGSLNSAAMIWIWYHPGLKGTPNNSTLRRQVWFTVEMDYYGDRPIGPTVMSDCFDKNVVETDIAGDECAMADYVTGPMTGSCPSYTYTGNSPPTGGQIYPGFPTNANTTFTGC